MGQKPARFFAGSSKPMRLGFLGFVVATVGALLGFWIDYRLGNPVAYVSFGMVVTGVAIGFVAVAWGWYTFFRRR
jgi:hypothetical protein